MGLRSESNKNITIDFLESMLREKKHINMLYYGPPGCGKTTTASVFGETLFPGLTRLRVMNINASDERGTGVIRDKIKSYIETSTLSVRKKDGLPKKMVVLDEVDYMIHDAQIGLSEIMDLHPDVLFIFICNYLQKISPQILSRTATIRFPIPSLTFLSDVTVDLMKQENVSYSSNAITLLCELSGRDIRNVIFTTKALATVNKKINTSHVYKYSQYPTDSEMNTLILNINKQNSIMNTNDVLLHMIEENGVRIENLITTIYKKLQCSKQTIDKRKWFHVVSELSSIEQMITYEYTPHIVIAHIASCLHQVLEPNHNLLPHSV
jgi:DNA polymerase III delta prime subunit